MNTTINTIINCPNCNVPLTTDEVNDKICWTCKAELEEIEPQKEPVKSNNMLPK
ncbi:MAG: hypothetical protein IPP48_03210 [Chitinophagaceae bacterium]|nr:hypothetical protein [Chitinophagaceae bacterium]